MSINITRRDFQNISERWWRFNDWVNGSIKDNGLSDVLLLVFPQNQLLPCRYHFRVHRVDPSLPRSLSPPPTTMCNSAPNEPGGYFRVGESPLTILWTSHWKWNPPVPINHHVRVWYNKIATVTVCALRRTLPRPLHNALEPAQNEEPVATGKKCNSMPWDARERLFPLSFFPLPIDVF